MTSQALRMHSRGVCLECRANPIPPGRSKYCSSACTAKRKRRMTREKRAGRHRHVWVCRKCGKRARLGRKPVLDEASTLKQETIV